MNNLSFRQKDISTRIFDARTEYYIGDFLGSLTTALPDEGTKGNPELLFYMYLSYLAVETGGIIKKDINETSPPPLLAVRYIYDAMEKPSRNEEILEKLTDRVATEEDETNSWHLATAIVYCQDGQFENALKILHGSNNLESMALSVQCLLRLNRVDLAKQLVAKMQEISDDATLTQLAQAWVVMAQGNEQMQDAFHIYQEFCDKFLATNILLNGEGVVHLGLHRYDEADAVLRDSLSKKPNDYSTLINLMVLAHLTGKSSETITRYWEQLRQFHPESEFVKDLDKKSAEFDKLCLQYELKSEPTSLLA